MTTKITIFLHYEILRLASVDFRTLFKEHIQFFMSSILENLLIVRSSAPSHLGFDILRFRKKLWHLLKAFR